MKPLFHIFITAFLWTGFLQRNHGRIHSSLNLSQTVPVPCWVHHQSSSTTLGYETTKYQFSLLSFTYRSAVWYGVLIKGLCHGCPVYFVFNAIYESLFSMKLDKLPVNDKNTSFVSNKVCLPSIISIVTNNNNELWKTVRLKKTTLAIRFNLLQVSPSMPPFVFSVSFIEGGE